MSVAALEKLHVCVRKMVELQPEVSEGKTCSFGKLMLFHTPSPSNIVVESISGERSLTKELIIVFQYSLF